MTIVQSQKFLDFNRTPPFYLDGYGMQSMTCAGQPIVPNIRFLQYLTSLATHYLVISEEGKIISVQQVLGFKGQKF